MIIKKISNIIFIYIKEKSNSVQFLNNLLDYVKIWKKSKDILEVKKVLLLKTKACLNGKENYINYTLINQKENTVKTVKKKLKVNVLRSLELVHYL